MESEIKELYEEGIKEEEDEDEKKHFEEIRDERIELIKDKVEQLDFWSKIQDGPVKDVEGEKQEEGIKLNGASKPVETNQPQAYALPEGFPNMTGKEVKIKERPKRTFPTSNSVVYHFHPIAFLEQMKRITAKKFNPDHGDWHDPIVNPQVRGHYPGQKGIHSEHIGWDTDRSRAINRRISSRTGKPRHHSGLDIYAPVGTPIYACQDAITVSRHTFRNNKSGGFDLNFKIKFNGNFHTIVYCHMMVCRPDDFCLGGVGGSTAVYHTYKSCINTKIIVLHKNAKFKVKYDPATNFLTVDELVVDLEIAKKRYNKDNLFKKGDIVGYVGMTGNAVQHRNTAHLHLTMYDQNVKELEPAKVLKKYITNEEEGGSMAKQDGYKPSSEW